MSCDKVLAKCLLRFGAVVFLAALPAYSQSISYGVKAGVPLSDAYTGIAIPDGSSGHFNDRYTVGPTVEFKLPIHFSFEIDLLYRHSGFDAVGGLLANAPNGNVGVKDFQLPLMVKYQMPRTGFRPFVDFGAAYRHLSTSGNAPPSLQDAKHADLAGIVLGTGVAFQWGNLKVTPEIRYTGWGQSAFSNVAVTSNVNQGDFLVGFTF